MATSHIAYHAVSVDEKRSHFPSAYWDESDVPEGQTIEQVWFPGFHADVGGQKADRRISDIPLEWVLRHAHNKGLKLRDDWRNTSNLTHRGLSSLHADTFGACYPQRNDESRKVPKYTRVYYSEWLTPAIFTGLSIYPNRMSR